MADATAPAGMHILCISLRLLSQTSLKITKVSFLLCFFNNLDSRAGLVLSMQKHFIIAKLTIWVWYGIAIMNRQIIYLHVFTDMLVNKLLTQ